MRGAQRFGRVQKHETAAELASAAASLLGTGARGGGPHYRTAFTFQSLVSSKPHAHVNYKTENCYLANKEQLKGHRRD